MRALVLLFLVISTASAQDALSTQVVRLGTALAQGIDQTRLDSAYIDASGRCAPCRFDSSRADEYNASRDAFLNELMTACVDQHVAFNEIVVRAYVAADGRLDYVLYYISEDPETDRRFVAALRHVASTFRFVTASGRFKFGATIAVGG